MREQRTENREQKNSCVLECHCSLFTVHCSRRASRGFTLVEMIVAVALFAVVMLIAVGALLSLTGANRKAQALQSVMNNLNIALDGMVRNIRMGTNYQCGGVNALGYNNCPGGDVVLAFKPNPDVSKGAAAWIYRFDNTAGGIYCGAHRLCKSVDGSTYLPITAPEVSIDSMTFYVVGAQPGDFLQPKVLIVVKGTAGAGSAKTRTTLHIEAMAVQRELDLVQ